jgi:hypothetical protein
MNTSEILQLESILANGNIEVRAFDRVSDFALKQKSGQVVWSGVFDDITPLRQALRYAEKSGWDIYSTINPSKIPATNGKLRPFMRTTRDADIVEIRKIFFDLDPVRETGAAAEQWMIDQGYERAEALYEFLSENGWCRPTYGFSGNGFHLYYSTRLPWEEAKPLLARLYEGLNLRFSDDVINFDTTVRNPARIARVMGSTNRKSGNRSHCDFSDEYLDPKLISRLADKIKPPEKQKRHWVSTGYQEQRGGYIKNMDIVGVFQNAGLYLQRTQESGKHFVTCPWQHEHSSTGATDTVIWEGEWAQFHCSHDHCSGRTIKDIINTIGDKA